MKVLLDECVTHDLRPLLVGHEVFTVAHLGWKGIKNGELLRRAVADGFGAMISTDHGLVDQHNAADLQLAVIVVFAKSGRIADVKLFVPAVLQLLASSPKPGFHLIN